MIWVSFNPTEKDRVSIKFSGGYFYELLEFCKSDVGLKYDPDTKSWFCTPFYFVDSNLLSSLRELDEVSIGEKTYEDIISFSKPKIEIDIRRRRYNEDVVSFNPIKGKAPNETYQIDDIKRFLNINRGGIFWEQGLGKAVFISVHVSQLFASGEADRALILTPSSGLYNLRREIVQFSNVIKEEDIQIITKDERNFFLEGDLTKKIVIMTYRTFLLLSDHHYRINNPSGRSKKYRKMQIPFDRWIDKKGIIYLDESHNIANPKARQTFVINLHKDAFYFRYVLTGTPADKIQKYYGQMKFLDDNLIPYSYSEWLPTVFNIGNRFSQYAINYAYPDKVAKFIDSIKPYIIQRKTFDHLDLPENLIKKIYINLSGRQKELYDSFITLTLKRIKEEEGSLTLQKVVNKFSQLTLTLDNPEIIHIDDVQENKYFNSLLKKWKFSDHCKLEVLDELVEEIIVEKNEKLIIWDGHPKTINDLALRYEKHKPLYIHGAVDFKEKGFDRDTYRDHIVEEFKNSDSKLLIASYRVLSTAITMTECHHQVYFTRGWDLINWLQSQKRIHRISQDKTVFTYVLLFEKTLEETQDKVLDKKENINNNLLAKDFLTKEEWKNLFDGGDITDYSEYTQSKEGIFV